MADKYCDPSAGVNGNGSFATPWNNLLECFKGSAGYAPAAGDTVYVRTKDGSGNNINITISASVTMSNTPTESAPITWIFDNGTVWPAGGLMTLTINASQKLNTQDNHIFKCQGALKFYSPVIGANAHHTGWVEFGKIEMFDPVFESVDENVNAISSIGQKDYQRTTLINPIFRLRRAHGASTGITYCNLYCGGYGSELTLINPIFDLGTANPNALGIVGVPNYGNVLRVFGGKVLNSVSSRPMIFMADGNSSSAASIIEFDGFDPGVCTLKDQSYASLGYTPSFRVASRTIRYANLPPSDKFCFFEENLGNYVSWFAGKNYPTLNAQLPDGTYWSVMVHAKWASRMRPVPCSTMSKLYTEAAAQKTVTVEMLINQNFGAIQGDEWFMDIVYVEEATGITRAVTTRGSVAVATSTAGWSATVYGSENYGRYKLSLLTPSAVRQNTDVSVRVWSTKAPQVSAETCFYFVDPDFVMS